MEVRQPTFKGPAFWTALLLIGLVGEAVIWAVAGYFATRLSVDSLLLGPLLFVLGLCLVYLGGQVLHGLFAQDPVAGMSLSLLAIMLAWAGAILLGLMAVFLVLLGLYAVVGIPVRIAEHGVRTLLRKRPAHSSSSASR